MDSKEAKGVDFIIVGGDLNHSEVTLRVPGLRNYVTTTTRLPNSIIDLLYTNHPGGWFTVDTVEEKAIYKQISDHYIVRACNTHR
jgi:hypothetical protein